MNYVKYFAWQRIPFANGDPWRMEVFQRANESFFRGMSITKMAQSSGLMPIPRMVRKAGTIERKSVLQYRWSALTSDFFDTPPIPMPRLSGLKLFLYLSL